MFSTAFISIVITSFSLSYISIIHHEPIKVNTFLKICFKNITQIEKLFFVYFVYWFFIFVYFAVVYFYYKNRCAFYTKRYTRKNFLCNLYNIFIVKLHNSRMHKTNLVNGQTAQILGLNFVQLYYWHGEKKVV
jgi:hypothetical protein